MRTATKFVWLGRAAAIMAPVALLSSGCQSTGEGSTDEGATLGSSRAAIVTELSGYAYSDQCLAQGVPVPPRFNYDACKANPPGANCGTGWVHNGVLDTLNGGTGDIFYYAAGPTAANPSQPEGLCIAFPRFFANPADNLLGVICEGKAASKACFWDRPDSGYIQSTTACYSPTQGSVPCSPATGGEELVDEPLAQCSDCHAGENAFIVHPGRSAFAGIPWLVSDNWVQPVVKESWPQDEGPGLYFLPASEDAGCGSCHGRQSRNRFPELSEKNKDFCFRLLGYENGLGASWHAPYSSSNVVGSTMPVGNPQLGADPTVFATYNALVAACDMPARYGRLARSLYHHSAGRGATPQEASHLGAFLESALTFADAQDDIVRPSLRKLSPTEPAVVVDGTLEDLWTFRSTDRVVNHRLFGTVSHEDDAKATWRAMWDDQYLYAFVTVFDDQRQTSGSPVYQDDSVELYLDGHRDGGNSYDSNDFQYLFRPGDGTVHVGGGRSNMSTAGVLYAWQDFQDSYTIEVAIPWTTLGVSPGGQMGMEIHVNDDDGGSRDAQLSWRTTATNSWTVPGNFTAVDLVTPLFFATVPVTVNGLADDPAWNLPAAEPLTRRASPIPLSNNTAVWQSRWDTDKLYVFVRVQDSSVLPPDGPKPYHDDSVEIAIDANNGHAGAIDFYDDFQFVFRAGESGVVRLGDVSATTDLGSIQSAVVMTSTGYDLEVSIPWTSLKTAPVDRATIGIEVQVNDDDTGVGTTNNEREGKIAFCSDSNESYHDTRYYCVQKLQAIGPLVTSLPRIARNAKAHDPNVPGVLAFDGSVNDSAWGASPSAIGNAVLGSPSAGGQWRGAWNEEYLYFHFLVGDPGGPQSNSGAAWHLDDSVELFVDPSNDRGSTYDVFDLQYIFKPGAAFQNQRQIGPNSRGFLGRDLSTEGIKVASQVTSGIYQIEVAIPWATLHLAPEPGLHMGLEVQINDDDAITGPGRDGKVAWFGSPAMGDVAWQRPDAFGVVQLGN